MKKTITAILIIALAAWFLFRGLFNFRNAKPSKILPYYGNKQLSSNGKDTLFHYVSNFSFINQEGKIVTEKNFDGCIYVANVFFATCQSICPIMSTQMERVAEHFKDNKQVKIISHTVNPEHDSVNVLADYAKLHHANNNQWYFVTGNKPILYKQFRESYLLDADTKGDGGVNDFIHSEYFVLVDKYKHIRGTYDGTDSTQVENLIQDMEILLKEY